MGRDSSVGITTGYGFNGPFLRRPDWLWAHPAFHSVGTRDSFHGDKAAEAWYRPLAYIFLLIGDFPLWGRYWPIVPALEQSVECFARETEVLETACPTITLSPTNPIWSDPGCNQGRRDGKPATSRPGRRLTFHSVSLWCLIFKSYNVGCRPWSYF
jgi:hypothetical protein